MSNPEKQRSEAPFLRNRGNPLIILMAEPAKAAAEKAAAEAAARKAAKAAEDGPKKVRKCKCPEGSRQQRICEVFSAPITGRIEDDPQHDLQKELIAEYLAEQAKAKAEKAAAEGKEPEQEPKEDLPPSPQIEKKWKVIHVSRALDADGNPVELPKLTREYYINKVAYIKAKNEAEGTNIPYPELTEEFFERISVMSEPDGTPLPVEEQQKALLEHYKKFKLL